MATALRRGRGMTATDVTLSLVSHTNVGKTTLARTLLRREVGEVADRAHVTEASEAHVLIETPRARLVLWDTPGFGDSRRLMDRLRRQRDPLGWFLYQVWDRLADRPLFCSQRAVRNVRDEADVVLYLVNAAEDPEHAGYVAPELEILSWIGRPVLLLLNLNAERDATAGRRWDDHVRNMPVVRGVLPLDAFSRCWVEEGVLLERVVPLLEETKQPAMRELSEAWAERNRDVFRSSCRALAALVAATALDEQAQAAGTASWTSLSGIARGIEALAAPDTEARAALDARLDERTRELMQSLIAAHGLSGTSAASLERQLADYRVRGRVPPDERSGAIAGAVVTGALGGLAADVASGGLTLGGGLIAGAILGALGGSAWARGYRLLRGNDKPRVAWTPEFLERLCGQVLLLYLAVAHYGRGRGGYEDLERPAHWSRAVSTAIDSRRRELQAVWDRAAARAESTSLEPELEAIFRASLKDVLLGTYPEARTTLVAV